MSDWKLFLECSNGHRFGIEAVCPDCDQVVAQHLHTEPQPGREPTWRERRALRKEIKRLFGGQEDGRR